MKKENIVQEMNNLTTFTNFDNDLSNYKDTQIKNFQEQINQLKKENEFLKKKKLKKMKIKKYQKI